MTALLLSMDPSPMIPTVTGVDASWGSHHRQNSAAGAAGKSSMPGFWSRLPLICNATQGIILLMSLGSGLLMWQKCSLRFGVSWRINGCLLVCKPFRPEDGPWQTFLSKASITAAGAQRHCHNTEHSEGQWQERSFTAWLTGQNRVWETASLVL